MFYKDEKTGIVIHTHGWDKLSPDKIEEKAQKCIKCIIENKVFERYFSDDYVDDDTDEYPFRNGGEE